MWFLLISALALLEPSRAVDIERNLYEIDKLIKAGVSNMSCQELLEDFSSSSSKFVMCANIHAKPISMCRNCKGDIIEMKIAYGALSNNTESGLLCKDILTSQDRVEIIQETYHYIADDSTGLWSKGHCTKCYTEPFDKDSMLSQETTGFFQRHSAVADCFEKHPFQETQGPRNSSAACHECQVYYQELSEYFKNILGERAPFTDNICFDILDAMNMTQRTWGEKYNCGRTAQHKDHIILIVAIIIVLLLPVVFYPVVRLTETSASERVISQRHITEFLEDNLRRLSFNRRSRFSRADRHSDQSSGQNSGEGASESNSLAGSN